MKSNANNGKIYESKNSDVTVFSSVTVSIVYLSASEFASTRSFFNTKTRDIEKTTSIVEMPIFSIPDDWVSSKRLTVSTKITDNHNGANDMKNNALVKSFDTLFTPTFEDWTLPSEDHQMGQPYLYYIAV